MLARKILLGLAVAIQWATACAGSCPNNSSNPGNIITVGTDCLAPPETLGYFISHFGLLTTDLPRLQHFYGNILGMRLMFHVQLTPEYSVTYLAHSQGGRNGTGFQTGQEMTRDKNNMAGILEIVQFNVSDDKLLSSTKRTSTFGHVGLIVPDIVKTQEYLVSKGVEVLKPYGDPIETFTGPVNNAFGIGEYAGVHQAAKQRLMDAQGIIGIPMLLMVADPDGNLVEIQQQVQPEGTL